MLSKIKRALLLHREPAVIIGLAATLASAITDALAKGMRWQDALPILAGIVIRFLVTPTP